MQGWEFTHSLNAHSLIRSSLICSFAHFPQIKWATVSNSLRLLKTNAWPWAKRSEEMSDREQITQVAQDKWETVSDDKWANERLAQKILAKQI